MQVELPKGQQRIWEALVKYRGRSGFLPYPLELARMLGLDRKGVLQQLEALERKGLLEIQARGRGLPAVLRLTPQGRLKAGLGIPLLGTVQAGPLGAPNQEVRGIINLPARSGLYGLEIDGLSLAPWLRPKDISIIKAEPLSYAGQVSVVRVHDETTFKKVYPKGRKLRLESVNPDFAPFVVPADEVEVQGVYCSHFGGELTQELLEVFM